MDTGTAAWITGAAALGGGLVGGLLSGSYQHWRECHYAPRLVLDYGVNAAASKVNVVTGKEAGDLDDWYIRVRLRNMGRTVARDCVVYLSSIQEVNETGTAPTQFHDAMPISWPLNRFLPLAIPPGPDFYVDLVKISKQSPGWHFGVQQLYASHNEMSKYKGTYRFNLVATADNAASAKLAVDVKYEQDPNSLRVFEASR